MNKDRLKSQVLEQNLPHLIVTHLAGSHSYGTSLPESDIDVRGIFCARRANICTPFYPWKEQMMPTLEDAKAYELTNFMKLYMEGNPNILETLWVDPKDVLTTSWPYAELRLYREALLSKKVAFTFSGYAISQLKRIKGHNKWINNPQPEMAPKQYQFTKMVQNFTNDKIFSKDWDLKDYNRGKLLVPYGDNIYGLVHSGYSTRRTINDDGSLHKIDYDSLPPGLVGVKPDFIVKFCKEEYKRAKDNHADYWKWKANRNEKRSLLEEKFGYDTKHAMHLVRLLRMGEEILTGKGVIVNRPDAKELLDIRAGLWNYDDLVKWAEEKDKFIRTYLYEKSFLPQNANIELASRVIMNIQEHYWSKQ